MQKLVDGIHKFQKDVFCSQERFFQRLADGQKPLALFITCSDSRIDPNMLTQTKPGELFIMRNAGNIVPPYGAASSGEAATIEYAVAVL
ncbi:MAG: carbonic anhydrase, partial [Pirellulales bacterium]|nr:carbonic anhydrase [Pirellulales bacterium]